MSAKGNPVAATLAELPPNRSIRQPVPSAAQRSAEAQVERDATHPPLKGNKHNGNGWPGR